MLSPVSPLSELLNLGGGDPKDKPPTYYPCYQLK